MQILMLETRRVSEDASTVLPLKKGEIYDIADNAARSAIRNGWAVAAEEADDMETVVTKIIASLRANRMNAALLNPKSLNQ